MFDHGAINILSAEECARIYETTLIILGKKGVRFTLKDACKIFRDAGFRLKNDIVFFKKSDIEKALSTVPPTFIRNGANSSRNVRIGDGSSAFAVGSLPIWVIDSQLKSRRKAEYQDMLKFITLAEKLDEFTIANSVVQPWEIPLEVMGAVWNRNESFYTTKPACCWYATNQQTALDTLEMLAAASGGKEELKLSQRWAITICLDSTLQWGKSIWGILELAKYNIPCEFLSMPFMGSTHPVTIAGTLTLAAAEVLAGITLCQLINPGCPVTFAPSYGGIMDMGTGSHAFGTPESALFAAAAAKFGKWLKIPTNLMMGTIDAKLPDAQAGVEKISTLLLPALAGADCITQAGGLLDFALSASYEQLMIDAEIVGQIQRLQKGFQVDTNSLALETILEQEHGGNFLQSMHTLENFKNEMWFTKLHDRQPYEKWHENGAKDMTQRAHECVKDLLTDSSPKVIGTEFAKDTNNILEEIFKRESFSGELAEQILAY